MPPKRRKEDLSTKPSQIRQRMRRGTAKLQDHYEDLGIKPLEEWDFDELAKGHPHGWRGGKNAPWLSGPVGEEIARRLNGELAIQMRKHLPAALKVMTDFLTDQEEPHLRFKAAQLLLEYIAGAPNKKLEITTGSKTEALLMDILVLDDGSPAHPVVDGQFYEEDDGDLPE